MTPRLRKFALLSHITTSVGWMGAVVPYLVLSVAGLLSNQVPVERAAYYSLALIGWYVLVPLSFAALISGLVLSLGTRWGLVRHWWVLAKLVLTAVATSVLLRHMQLVSRIAKVAAGQAFSSTDLRMERLQLVIHPAGGLLVLLVITALSVFKPWGMTPYGRRNASQTNVPSYPRIRPASPRGRVPVHATLRWPQLVGMHVVGVGLLLMVILHLTRGGMQMH